MALWWMIFSLCPPGRCCTFSTSLPRPQQPPSSSDAPSCARLKMPWGFLQDKNIGVGALPEDEESCYPSYGLDSSRSTTSESVWLRTMPSLLPSKDQRKSEMCSDLKLVICFPGEPSIGWSQRLSASWSRKA